MTDAIEIEHQRKQAEQYINHKYQDVEEVIINDNNEQQWNNPIYQHGEIPLYPYKVRPVIDIINENKII